MLLPFRGPNLRAACRMHVLQESDELHVPQSSGLQQAEYVSKDKRKGHWAVVLHRDTLHPVSM